jgi:hypothetical protein
MDALDGCCICRIEGVDGTGASSLMWLVRQEFPITVDVGLKVHKSLNYNHILNVANNLKFFDNRIFIIFYVKAVFFQGMKSA